MGSRSAEGGYPALNQPSLSASILGGPHPIFGWADTDFGHPSRPPGFSKQNNPPPKVPIDRISNIFEITKQTLPPPDLKHFFLAWHGQKAIEILGSFFSMDHGSARGWCSGDGGDSI